MADSCPIRQTTHLATLQGNVANQLEEGMSESQSFPTPWGRASSATHILKSGGREVALLAPGSTCLLPKTEKHS